MQPGVETVFLEQFVVRADFDDSSPLQHDQPIRLLQRAQTMGDGDRRAALDQVVQRELNLALGLGVDGAGGLVEDQNLGVDEQRPGNRNPLPLAAGEELPRSPTSES